MTQQQMHQQNKTIPSYCLSLHSTNEWINSNVDDADEQDSLL